MPIKIKTNKVSTYNPALDQYSNIDLFPEKTKKAEEALNKPGVLNWLKSIQTTKNEDAKKNKL